jgi:hypothetical protein
MVSVVPCEIDFARILGIDVGGNEKVRFSS